MDVTINEAIVYPELRTFELINLFSETKNTITHAQLINAFGEDESARILAGRNPAWQAYEIFNS